MYDGYSIYNNSGETLYGIAKKYEVKIDEILVLNPKIKNKSLKLNEVIKIPNSKKDHGRSVWH